MDSKLIKGVIVLTIGVLLASTVLVPIVSDSSDSLSSEIGHNDNFNNRMSKVTSATIICGTVGGDITFTHDGRTYDYNSSINARVCYFHSDSCWLEEDRAASTGPVLSFISGTDNVQLYDKTWTLTVVDGIATLDYGTSHTLVVSEYSDYNYIFDPNGDYIFNDHLSLVVVDSSAQNVALVMRGWWGVSINSTEFTIDDVDGGISAKKYVNNPFTVSDVTLQLSVIDNNDGSYSFGGSATVIDSLGQETEETGLGIIAPYEYTYHVSNSASKLVLVLPVLVIVALMMVAVNFVRVRD